MWTDPRNALDAHLKTSHTLQIESLVVGEWNMNDFVTLDNYGVYRNRPGQPTSKYYRAPLDYDKQDAADSYLDSEQSVFSFSDFVDTSGCAVFKEVIDVDRELYFSLKDCFNPFRPRSGINKAMYFEGEYIEDVRTARRPRYYMCSRDDPFKYWNSYRQQVIDLTATELGISQQASTGYDPSIGYIIDDTAPFAVYNAVVPMNKIIVKMQTNMADATYDEVRTHDDNIIDDPFASIDNSTIPKRWRIEYLDEYDNWQQAMEFDENSSRSDNSAIVPWDGYVELSYGVKAPERFRTSFNLVEYLDGLGNLPQRGLTDGEAYVIGFDNGVGDLYIWDASVLDWYTEAVSFGFTLTETDDTKRIGLIKSLVSPRSFTKDGKTVYADIVYAKGLRIVVDTMFGPDKTFNLIELSPRLRADLSTYTNSYSFVKTIANDATGLPVGGLLASNGDISLSNYDGAFSSFNESSIIAGYLKPNVKFDFYEAILAVDGYDKFIPMKTMYAESFPDSSGGMTDIQIPVRDAFFRLEDATAPQMLATDISLTGAVALLLDSIGFSNYVFKGFDDILGSLSDDRAELQAKLDDGIITIAEYDTQLAIIESDREYFASYADPVIPYFTIEPDISVAQVLVNLAMATQAAMFFDEYNNFVLMPKEHILPASGSRSADVVLYGQESGTNLPNIISIDNSVTTILNDGVINYSVKYIQRSFSKLSQAFYVDHDKTFTYKPVLLWEVAAQQETKTVNEASKQGSGYSLGAAALNTTLSASAPTVVNNVVTNNVIDLGESIYWLGRFQGYLFANGEIIRYDAIEYDVSGTGKVWITSNQQYQKYFAKLPFNGKIFPTGSVRIWTEPFYVEFSGAPATTGLDADVTYKNGAVSKHGRAQFGTEIVEHPAGLPEYWYDDDNVRGCRMKGDYLFNTTPTNKISYPAEGALGNAIGMRTDIAKLSRRTGIIKNFMRRQVASDNLTTVPRVTSSGTIQSSALVFSGPNEQLSASPTLNEIDRKDFISYVYKNLDGAFKHFGTRLRLIGKLKINGKVQDPSNSFQMFSVQPTSAKETVTIDGGSAGIGVGVNPDTNCGYYFEVAALTTDNINEYNKSTGGVDAVLHNVMFYKLVPDTDGNAIPKKLWGGIANIIVDEGIFVGQDRVGQQENPSVYDLAVEYENRGSVRRFYLYINNAQVAYVDDSSPLPQYTGSCLFVRGTTEAMFENFYALQDIVARNTESTVINEISAAFGPEQITTSQLMNKYSLPGFIKSTYLTGIGTGSSPRYKIYLEEFGTIMREVGYFNIKYDQAYPAFSAKIAKTFTNERGYTVSNFIAGSYGAEFLVFNSTDKAITLDETTGNYLRIIGVTFTQNTLETLTVDDYMKDRSRLSDPVVINNVIKSPVEAEKVYDDVKKSRSKYGRKQFALESLYIQSNDAARSLMDWIVNKTLRERQTVQMELFGTPQLQLGDIVTIDYELPDGSAFTDPAKQFSVFEISQSKADADIITNVRVVEI
jgi:hypothetical protein